MEGSAFRLCRTALPSMDPLLVVPTVNRLSW